MSSSNTINLCLFWCVNSILAIRQKLDTWKQDSYSVSWPSWRKAVNTEKLSSFSLFTSSVKSPWNAKKKENSIQLLPNAHGSCNSHIVSHERHNISIYIPFLKKSQKLFSVHAALVFPFVQTTTFYQQPENNKLMSKQCHNNFFQQKVRKLHITGNIPLPQWYFFFEWWHFKR